MIIWFLCSLNFSAISQNKNSLWWTLAWKLEFSLIATEYVLCPVRLLYPTEASCLTRKSRDTSHVSQLKSFLTTSRKATKSWGVENRWSSGHFSKQQMEVQRNDKLSCTGHQSLWRTPERTVQEARIYAGPLFPYFQPVVSQPSCFQVCGRRTCGRKKKTPPTLQGCLRYREMRKGETSALWICTNHLTSSHQASTPQNSTPICHWFVIRPLWVNVGEVFYLTRASQGPNWMKLLLFSVKWHHENFIREASWEAGKGLQNYPHINWFIYAFCMFARGGANMWRTKINIRGLFLSFHTVTPAAKGESSDMAASPFPTEKSHRTQLRKTETTSLMVTLWPWGPPSLQVMFTQ